MTIDQYPDSLPYDLLDGMAQEWVNASGGTRTYGARIADALRYADGQGYMLVPVPDGVAYDDALRAVNDAAQWVEWGEERGMAPWGARVRDEFQPGKSGTFRRFVHRDDVPDPDADLIERMAKALDEQATRGTTWVDMARAALAVIREDQP